MALTQPILNSIPAFDATQSHVFSFISIGGDQVVGCQLTIYDNETGTQVYQGNYTSFKFEYPLAAGVLTNGKYYNATISTINNASQFSEPSSPVAFYCYTTPILTITNIPASGTIEQSNYLFQGNYVQVEGELLNGYQYILYNSNKEKISQSDILYDNLYQHTFSGMSNDTSYYIELTGFTVNNTPVTSGQILFTVRYIQPASFAICDLVNNCQNGYIQISSNIVSIDGKSNPEPPTYIDNKEVDLTENGSWVKWDEGFNIQNDFILRVWGRDFTENEPIIIMSNDLNTETIPNKIEMKYMTTDIIETLPAYIMTKGTIITTENAKEENLKDLNISGNSVRDAEGLSIDNPKEIGFTGDKLNIINLPNTQVSYAQDTYVAVQPANKYILIPNKIYTLMFNYVVNNSTTDIYYGISFGTNTEAVGDIEINGNTNVQYITQNKGQNIITFQTPSSFTGVDIPYLWIKFAKTIITADVNVSISNVGLYEGEYSGEYEEYGKYIIPMRVSKNNLYDYTKPLYVVDNNTIHENISNGYSVHYVTGGEDSYLLIGVANNLMANGSYSLLYQTSGSFKEFHLYSSKKNSSEIVNEIQVNNNIFVAPENYYDLIMRFDIDSNIENSYLNIWNIQILTGNGEADYSSYEAQIADVILNEPLREIQNKRDTILISTVNLLNPDTLKAYVRGNTTYTFSSNTTNNYLLDFYNIDNNLIDSEDISQGTFTTPSNCSYITSTDFTKDNVISEEIQIEAGDQFIQYLPYIEAPSIIRKTGEIILTGEENWQLDEITTNSVSAYLSGEPYSSIKEGISNYFSEISAYSQGTDGNNIWYNSQNSTFGIKLNKSLLSSPDLQGIKDFIKDKYNTIPIKVYYILPSMTIIPLAQEYVSKLENLKTNSDISNIFVGSKYPGYIKASYANNYADQETKEVYVILKCWNENSIPYIIHSNYIIVNSERDKIFIWTKRKNNLFDLRIENLGEE